MRAALEAFLVREWQRVSLWQIVLQPLSWVFATLVFSRRALFGMGLLRRYQAPIPIIVVGNITVGGTGKTPLVIALTHALQQSGKAVAVVSRGYRADSGVSDEAELIRQRTGAAVHTQVSREMAIRAALMRRPALDAIVADDGMQHLALRRDIEIAVVDGERGFGNGFLLPAGPLREGVSRLGDVDCIVVNESTTLQPTPLPQTPHQCLSLAESLQRFAKPVFVMRYGNPRFQKLNNKETIAVADFLQLARNQRVAAMAGIGYPPRFFAALESLGLILASRHSFPDHHTFTSDDVRSITADIIVMTEKDAVKCGEFNDSRLWVLQIDAVLPDAFYAFVADRLTHVARP